MRDPRSEKLSAINAHAFNNQSWLAATGANANGQNNIVDEQVRILAYVRTGGMMNPERRVLEPGKKIFRFGASGRSPQAIAAGAWWVEQTEFDKLFSFAQVHNTSLGIAVRCLCLVPPEWSDLGVVIRARVARELLAWRGLGDSVVTPTQDGGTVRLPHHNEIAARRLHQLFIPGLNGPGMPHAAMTIEADFKLEESRRGFLYL